MCATSSLVAFAVEFLDTVMAVVAEKVYKTAAQSEWAGSIGLVVVDMAMVPVHSLFVVAFVVANPGLVEVVAFVFPFRYLYIMLFGML